MIRSVARCVLPLLLLLAGLVLITACNQPPQDRAAGAAQSNARLASVQGQVLLQVPDPVTSHGGIVVFLPGTSFQARTSSGGSYRIDNIPGGAYEIQAEKPGFQPTLVDTVVLDPAKHTADKPALAKIGILEQAAGQTTGTAAGQLGGIEGVVYLQGQERSGGVRVQVDGTQFVTVSNDDGAYRVMNLPAGNYSLTFSRQDYRPFTATNVMVASGLTTTLAEAALERISQPVIVGAPAATTTATVVATPIGTPIVASQMNGDRVITGMVELTDAQGASVTDFTRAVVAINDSDIVATLDDQGRFRIPNLSPGIYTLIGSMDNGEPTKVPVDLTTQQTATVLLKISGAAAAKSKGSVIGRVILPGLDDQPLPDASGVRIGLAGTQATAISAKDGTFKLEDVPEGTYSVVATKDGYEDFKSDNIEVTAATPTDLGEITLEAKRDYPRVIGTIPASGTRDIPVGLDIVLQVKFSKKMDPASVRNAVSVQPATSAQILFGRGSHPLADDDRLVVVMSSLDQKSPIRFGTNYQLAIAKTASDVDGVSMREDYVMNFATGTPGIIGTRPGNGEQNVYVDQNEQPVIINFNTRINPNDLNERNIRVRPDNGISVSLTHTEDPRTGWTNLRIATQWQPDTHYTITIGREVRALNGQVLGNTPYSLRFRTQQMNINAAPVQVVR
jgi:hypothetical protein